MGHICVLELNPRKTTNVSLLVIQRSALSDSTHLRSTTFPCFHTSINLMENRCRVILPVNCHRFIPVSSMPLAILCLVLDKSGLYKYVKVLFIVFARKHSDQLVFACIFVSVFILEHFQISEIESM